MKANVYVLVERRATAVDIWMVGGTQQELLDYYFDKLKHQAPGDVERVNKDGVEHLIFDRDRAGGLAMISQYRVGIAEILDAD
jgi:hypothetical protein